MTTREIGLPELRLFVRRSWWLVVGLGLLSGVTAFAVLSLWTAEVYQATAKLAIQPLDEDPKRQLAQLYRAMLQSGPVVDETAQRVAREIEVPKGYWAASNRNLSVRSQGPSAGPGRGASVHPVLELVVRSPLRDQAPVIANTWAQVFLEKSQSMLMEQTSEIEEILRRQISPVSEALQSLEAERIEQLGSRQEREDEAWSAWERRLAAAEKAAMQEEASYRVETRSLMRSALEERFPELSESGSGRGEEELFAALLEVVALREQLASTPRVLELQKTAPDETLYEILFEEGDTEGFDGVLIEEEIDPVHEHLVSAALENESRARRLAGSRQAEVSSLLEDLRRIGIERAAGLAALEGENEASMRVLRRRQRRELKRIQWETNSALNDSNRELERLRDLESRLSNWINRGVVSGSLDRVGLVTVIPASGAAAIPRRFALKVAVALFLGAVLGLMLGLYRTRFG